MLQQEKQSYDNIKYCTAGNKHHTSLKIGKENMVRNTDPTT